MTYVIKTFEERMKAARTMSAIVLSEADVEIAPEVIERLLNAKWARLAPLAHAVHSGDDNTKGQPRRPATNPDGYQQAGVRWRYKGGSMAGGDAWRYADHAPSALNAIDIDVEPVFVKPA